MADPGDPLGSGGIPLGNDLIAAAQLLAGFVQLLGKLPRKAGGRQADRTALRQGIQPGCYGLQAFAPAPAEEQAAPQHHQQEFHHGGLNAFGQHHYHFLLHVDVILPAGSNLFRHNKQPVIRRPALHGVIGQVPVGEHGNFRCRVPVIQLLRQVLLPDDIAIIVQHHGPGIALHPFRRGMFPTPLQAGFGLF